MPIGLPLVALSKRSTSASVRYSRVRRSALGRRVGVTVRFTVPGATSFRCDFAMRFAPCACSTVRIMSPITNRLQAVLRREHGQSRLEKWVPFGLHLRFWRGRAGHFKNRGLKPPAAARLRPHMYSVGMMPQGQPMCHGLIKIKAAKARLCLIVMQHPLDGSAG